MPILKSELPIWLHVILTMIASIYAVALLGAFFK